MSSSYDKLIGVSCIKIIWKVYVVKFLGQGVFGKDLDHWSGYTVEAHEKDESAGIPLL